MARGTAGGRERLLDAALELFGERGYRGTTVGDIEARAGLSPRAGAFYRHFASKEEAFRAALDRWIADVVEFPGSVGALLPLADRRDELRVVARGTLLLLSRQRPLFRFLAGEGADFPELVAQVHDDLVAQGYAQMIEFLSERLRPAAVSPARLQGLAAVALGALVHYRQDEAIYGHAPAGAGEDAFVEAWVEVWSCWFADADTSPSSFARSRNSDRGVDPR